VVDLREKKIADGVIVEVTGVPIDPPPGRKGNEVAVLDEKPLYPREVAKIVRYALSGQDVAKACVFFFLGGPDDERDIELVGPYDAVMLAVAEAVAPKAQRIVRPSEFIVSDLQFFKAGEGGEYGFRLLWRSVNGQKVELVFISLTVYARVAFADNPSMFDRDYDGII
jgi:hypothetical protein